MITIITKRDQNIINFLEDFHVATSHQIHDIFFNNTSYRYTRMRLQYLFEQKHIKRIKNTISNGYAYYIDKKPLQIHHNLLRTELYVNINKLYNIVDWQNEIPIGNIRPDAFAYIEDNSIIFPVFIEVHLNNKFDFEKYKKLKQEFDFKLLFKFTPRVIICTDQELNIPKIGYIFRIVNTDMSGINKIFK